MSEGKGGRTTTPRPLEIALATFKQELVLIMIARHIYRMCLLRVLRSVIRLKGNNRLFL